MNVEAQGIKAGIVVLEPVDESQLKRLGLVVRHEVINSERDELLELINLGRALHSGETLPIEYSLKRDYVRIHAVVDYAIDVRPEGAFAGPDTIVVIQSFHPLGGTLRTMQREGVQGSMLDEWESLRRDGILGQKAGLSVDYVKARMRSLEESLSLL